VKHGLGAYCRRITEHAARFDELMNGLDDAALGRALDPVSEQAFRTCQLVDDVFPKLDLEWWA
jgi:hypothetical protein